MKIVEVGQFYAAILRSVIKKESTLLIVCWKKIEGLKYELSSNLLQAISSRRAQSKIVKRVFNFFRFKKMEGVIKNIDFFEGV